VKCMIISCFCSRQGTNTQADTTVKLLLSLLSANQFLTRFLVDAQMQDNICVVHTNNGGRQRLPASRAFRHPSMSWNQPSKFLIHNNTFFTDIPKINRSSITRYPRARTYARSPKHETFILASSHTPEVCPGICHGSPVKHSSFTPRIRMYSSRMPICQYVRTAVLPACPTCLPRTLCRVIRTVCRRRVRI
jgi:hypothetical protein